MFPMRVTYLAHLIFLNSNHLIILSVNEELGLAATLGRCSVRLLAGTLGVHVLPQSIQPNIGILS
jgi:hypothetical protein